MAKQSKVAQAYERCAVARKALSDSGARCIEATEDKCGILWERWIVGPEITSVILYSTPDWWNVFSPLTASTSIAGTLEAIERLAKGEQFITMDEAFAETERMGTHRLTR